MNGNLAFGRSVYRLSNDLSNDVSLAILMVDAIHTQDREAINIVPDVEIGSMEYC